VGVLLQAWEAGSFHSNVCGELACSAVCDGVVNRYKAPLDGAHRSWSRALTLLEAQVFGIYVEMNRSLYASV
jgi:hypothetical protein